MPGHIVANYPNQKLMSLVEEESCIEEEEKEEKRKSSQLSMIMNIKMKKS